jgi:hypothetical protein
MNSPAVDISAILVLSASASGLTEGRDLFISRMPSIPDAAVAIIDTGGFEPASSTERNEYPTVQVMVRGTINTGYATAYSTMNTIKGVLHKFNNQTINSTLYQGIWASSDIISLGYDENDRPTLTLNFRIHRTA